MVATVDAKSAYKNADFVIISTPTNYDDERHFFDTSSVEAVIELVIECNPNAVIVIKSTIPVGYTKSVIENTNTQKFFSVPNFCVRARLSMITSIRQESLSVLIWQMKNCKNLPRLLQQHLQTVQLRKT